MDAVQQFCRRVLGVGKLADAATAQARAEASDDRIELLAAAAQACRERADREQPQPGGTRGDDAGRSGLSESVADELAAATASLPERQREALALRELLRLSHDQVSRVMGIEPAAVAPLLARSRLRLRAERRGGAIGPESACPDRDRALRVLSCRQDSEPLTVADDAWLLEHLSACEECDRAHAAMLEASVCYRAWPVAS